MIVLICTHCRGRLEIDDAFAGGVCRCMYCGTIQTVPSHLKRPGAVKKVKALYKQSPRPISNGNGGTPPANGTGGSGSGAAELEQLADIVASSGLGGSGLSGSGLTGSGLGGSGALPSPRIRAQTVAPPPATLRRRLAEHRTALLAAAGAGCALILLAILLLTFASGDASPEAPAAVVTAAMPLPPGPAPAGLPAEPNFCGVRLGERVVIYVLDRGSATGEMFGYLKEACYRSIESLGEDHQFQIIFWNNGTGEQAFPRTGPTFATPANLEAARLALDDVYAHGQSEAMAALVKAFAAHPDAIVLATGKAYELDETFLRSVEQMRAPVGAVKIHTFALGSNGSAVLRQLARNTGGEHRSIPAGLLREYAQ